MPIFCFVFDLDDVLLQTTAIFSQPHTHHMMRKYASNVNKAYKLCITPDPELHRSLSLLRGPKFILTNASRTHALAAVQALHIHTFFIGQLDADSGVGLKPGTHMYTNMKKIVHSHIPIKDKQIVFFDDRLENLVPPFHMGWITVWIHPQSKFVSKPSYVSYAFPRVHEALQFFHRVQQ